ncbi:hypothetical protein [Corynebacterium belfantii]|uniref:hypothetical protein n=1 Tax=Corynebacterium belfantii TaxID=2014537 RepID=UPI0018D3940E|nr:hypothetical protein [Corynebacterium belfantii]
MGFAEMGICVDHVEILKPACKFTLAMLADRADPYSDAEKTVRRTDGRVECWPSVDDIMESVRLFVCGGLGLQVVRESVGVSHG